MLAPPFPRTRFEVIDCDCTLHRPHGVMHTYYEHRCGCDDCQDARRTHDAKARKARAEGGPLQIPVAPVRAHIKALCAAGMSMAEIGRRTGYSRSQIHRIRRHTQVIDRFIAEDILSVKGA